MGTLVLGPPKWWAPPAAVGSPGGGSTASNGAGGVASGGVASGGVASGGVASGGTGGGGGAAVAVVGNGGGGTKSKEPLVTGAALAGLALPGPPAFGAGCGAFSVEAGFGALPPPAFDPDHLSFAADDADPASAAATTSDSGLGDAAVPYGGPQLFLQYSDRSVHRDACVFVVLLYVLHCLYLKTMFRGNKTRGGVEAQACTELIARARVCPFRPCHIAPLL